MTDTRTISTEQPQPIPLSVSAGEARALSMILLVEDEALVRQVANDVLEREGYRVLTAKNSVEAKVAFQRHGGSVKLLIADVVLPGQNGLELARELKLASRNLGVVLISGFPENAWTRQAHTVGEIPYLPKPFSADSLLRVVRDALAFKPEKVAI